MSGLVHHYGLLALFLIVMLESGGVPLPGETALIAGGVYASSGELDIVAVITVAAAAAIIGDNPATGSAHRRT
jgi:membrane protein DedA with SNARE-associated domain